MKMCIYKGIFPAILLKPCNTSAVININLQAGSERFHNIQNEKNNHIFQDKSKNMKPQTSYFV